MTLFEKHKARLFRAVEAMRARESYTPFIESPSRRFHPEGAHDAGREAFEQRKNKPFDFADAPAPIGRVDEGASPFTGEPLGITYPRYDVPALMDAVQEAWVPWRHADPQTRAGVCMEILTRWHEQVFENAYATMHTTGQAFMLAFAGSGANSLDRGLEGVAAAWAAMSQITRHTTYTRRFGREDDVRLEKHYSLRPVGVAIVLSCGSYPAWNAYPAITANLATGNPVVLKPHPDTILPMAIAVETARAVLREQGFDPNLITLAADTWDDPIAVSLFDHNATAIIDFTGGQSFGHWIERNYAHLQVYTETAGCNALLLESAHNLDEVLEAIAHSLCLFSSQMCTAPQNIWMPKAGVLDGDRLVPTDEVVARLIAFIDAIADDPKHVSALCGALHSEKTLEEMDALRDAHPCHRDSSAYTHPDFPHARTATTMIIAVDDVAQREVAQRECFGPVAFVLIARNREEALELATDDAQTHGAIACYAYTTDDNWIDDVEDAFFDAGASVGINLIRHRPLNFTAAFSDYHVTGLNPAGNACLTDPAFVTRRFRIVQSKIEHPKK